MTQHLLACRDVDLTRLQQMVPDLPPPPHYPGSVEGHCAECAVAVLIGPRQQQAIRDLPNTLVVCFVCAARTGALAVSLGNPYKPDPS